MSSCFLLGNSQVFHREALIPRLEEAIQRHIVAYGVDEFVVGHYGAFDALAAEVLAGAKEDHPTLTLLCMTPYHPSEQALRLPRGFDGVYYPAGLEKVPRPFAISRANYLLIDESDFLIAYVDYIHRASTFYTYALRRQARGLLRVENLGRYAG